jgi:hypothetical protein
METVATQMGDLIISVEYAPDNSWCDMWDNQVLAWLVDETGATESAPAVVGSLPPVKTGTDPIKSPQWGHIRGNSLIVPDLWRGPIGAFFTWLSTNNGASRKLRGNFLDSKPLNAFNTWAQQNPTMVWAGPGS